MKEEYRGYRPGDRVQMVERNDPYAPILPGEKGAIAHIDDAGTLHMKWDNGRTLGVCLEEDTVRKVPPEQEMELLSTEPLLQCDESQWDAHCEQSVALTGVMQRFAEEQGRDWVVKRSYIDEIHSPRPPKYQYVEAGALDDLIEGTCDLKKWNGRRFHGEAPAERAVHSDHRVWAGLHGAVGHASREGAARAQARLPPAATRDFRERVEVGWDPDGRAAMQLFNSPGDHQSIAPFIRVCKESVRSMPPKGKGRER